MDAEYTEALVAYMQRGKSRKAAGEHVPEAHWSLSVQ
jgi:hypothetical protein